MAAIYFDGKCRYIPDQQTLAKITCNEFYELQKLATEFKTNKEWEMALACLYKAKYLAVSNNHAPELQYVMRLALFLQQANHFEESKAELQELFETVDVHTQNLVKGLNRDQALLSKKFKALYLETLFDKARLIYKRGKCIQEAEHFGELSLQYRKEVEYLDNIIDEQVLLDIDEMKQEIAKYSATEQLENESGRSKYNNVLNFVVGLVFITVLIYILLV